MLVNKGVGSSANFQIEFSKASHNDDTPFDGSSSIVAHAFPRDHHRTRETYFDDDEGVPGSLWSRFICPGKTHGPYITMGPSYGVTGSHMDSIETRESSWPYQGVSVCDCSMTYKHKNPMT